MSRRMKCQQLPDVNCHRGAPMGRPSWPLHPSMNPGAFATPGRCFKLRMIDGAYDDGGAYWGSPADLYCATNDLHGNDQDFQGDDDSSFCYFVRAGSRDEAKRKVEALTKGLVRWLR